MCRCLPDEDKERTWYQRPQPAEPESIPVDWPVETEEEQPIPVDWPVPAEAPAE